MNIEYLKSMFDYTGKNAIVTGASQGIGKGIAVSLAKLGANITILGRNEKLLQEACEEIRAEGASCEYASFDITDQKAVDAFFADYFDKHEKLDIYVSNAAFTVMKSALDTSAEEINSLYATNFRGALLGLQHAAAKMKQQKSGNIVITTSVNALNPLPSQGVYTTTKCALEGLVKCLAADLVKYGIRVNSIAPGAVNTNLNAEMFVNPELRKQVDAMVPLGYVAEPAEMGDVVACMVSDAFRYMTGSTVLVDGGLNLRMS